MNTLNINGRSYEVIGSADMSTLPKLAEFVSSINYVKGSRGAVGSLYTRKDGSKYVVWQTSNYNVRTEEVAA